MSTASLSDLKTRLLDKNPKELAEICIKLARYKKENKELLDYILNYDGEENRFIQKAKDEVNTQLDIDKQNNTRNSVKIIRKALKLCLKSIKYSGIKETEIELLLFFCLEIKNRYEKYYLNPVLKNMFDRQITKISKVISGLHSDLQFDYQQEIEKIIA